MAASAREQAELDENAETSQPGEDKEAGQYSLLPTSHFTSYPADVKSVVLTWR